MIDEYLKKNNLIIKGIINNIYIYYLVFMINIEYLKNQTFKNHPSFLQKKIEQEDHCQLNPLLYEYHTTREKKPITNRIRNICMTAN